jgi:hypothetical protein
MQCNVFICSAGHSGSTLLDMMLGSHFASESVGELQQHLDLSGQFGKNGM